MSENIEACMLSSMDQDYAAIVDWYDSLSPTDRGELALWIAGKNGDMSDAPEWVRDATSGLAGIAFMEIGMRWATRQEVTDG